MWGDRQGVFENKLNLILKKLNLVINMEAFQMGNIQDLFDLVESETSVDASILALVDQLVALVQAAGPDQAKIDEAIATITANKQAIVDKVKANTPIAPPPVPPAN